MRYEYLAYPFIGKIKKSQGANEVSSQLQNAINEHARSGWEFYQLADVNIEVKSGCLESLFGSPVTYMRYDQLIFRKEVS